MLSADDLRADWLPRIPSDVLAPLQTAYPQLRFSANADTQPLTDIPTYMLVAFTGTGKTTTLDALAGIPELHYSTTIPTRREIADAIILPVAQLLLGEPVQPVTDRVARFRLTGHFGQQVQGGYVAAYAGLHMAWDGHTPFVSDGIRGSNEVSYCLQHLPNWHIIELWADPLTRLKRLSHRRDDFDAVQAAPDLAFLPDDLRERVRAALDAGQITPSALTIVQAEAQNYGVAPAAEIGTPRYHRLSTEDATPLQIAEQIAEIIQA